MFMSVLPTCLQMCTYMCATCMPCAHGSQKRVLDPLGLKVLMVMSHVGAGNQSQGLWKSSQYSF